LLLFIFIAIIVFRNVAQDVICCNSLEMSSISTASGSERARTKGPWHYARESVQVEPEFGSLKAYEERDAEKLLHLLLRANGAPA